MKKSQNPIKKPVWQKVEDVPDVALEWNEEDLVMRGEESIFENETLIGTGAGGKDERLRCYFIFVPKRGLKLSESTRVTISLAAEAVARRFDCVLEETELEFGCILVSVLIPFNYAPASFADELLEIWAKGKNRILRYHYYVTNIAKPGKKEIREYLDYLAKEGVK